MDLGTTLIKEKLLEPQTLDVVSRFLLLKTE